MLQTYFVPVGGRIINAKGRYLRIESVSAGGLAEDVRVRADGQDLGTYLPGDALQLPADCSTWEVTPTTASATATVRVGIGSVESSRIFGAVVVIDSLAPTVETRIQSYLNITALQATALVTPAANTNGVIVRGFAVEVQAGAGGNSDCMLIAAPAAPVSVVGAQMATLGRIVDAAGSRQIFGQWQAQRRIPVGWGLYHVAVNQTAAAAANAVRVCFELQ